jgi:hypothetical protein
VELQRRYCARSGYPHGLWGLSACDGPKSYRAYQPGHRFPEKVIAPPALLAALPFAPDQVAEGVRTLARLGVDDTPYGLRCAIDLRGHTPDRAFTGWKSPDAVGIDVGSTLLMLDGYTGKTVHRALGRCEIVQRALERAGFVRPAAKPAPAATAHAD